MKLRTFLVTVLLLGLSASAGYAREWRHHFQLRDALQQIEEAKRAMDRAEYRLHEVHMAFVREYERLDKNG